MAKTDTTTYLIGGAVALAVVAAAYYLLKGRPVAAMPGAPVAPPYLPPPADPPDMPAGPPLLGEPELPPPPSPYYEPPVAQPGINAALPPGADPERELMPPGPGYFPMHAVAHLSAQKMGKRGLIVRLVRQPDNPDWGGRPGEPYTWWAYTQDWRPTGDLYNDIATASRILSIGTVTDRDGYTLYPSYVYPIPLAAWDGGAQD